MSRPRRGDVLFVSFEPHRGSEQAGHRPALVVSNDRTNARSSLITVVAITHTVPRNVYPHNVPLPTTVLDGAGGTILCNQILTISQERLGRYLERLPQDLMEAVDQALLYHLGL